MSDLPQDAAAPGQGRNELGQFAEGGNYTPEIAVRFCTEIADGKSLRRVCNMDGMPKKATVFVWLRDNPEFARLYQVACEERAEGYAEEIVDIADDGTNDYVQDGEGGTRCDHEHIQRSKLRVDARKWIACKLKPKKYGDKVALTGDDGGAVRVVMQMAPTDETL